MTRAAPASPPLGVIVRSAVFALAQAATTVVFAIASLFTWPLPPFARYRVITQWTRIQLWLLDAICDMRWRVLHAERIPTQPAVVLSKHQSAWETLAFQKIFPPQVWVLKRELLRVPFFGWGLAMLSPVAIDRASGRQALKQLVEQGRERMARGFWVVIFPEGTRVPPGQRGEYRIGGAWLAAATGAVVVPVAHNAGTVYGRNAFIKWPGTITVSIGPTIDGRGRRADDILKQVETWIEDEMPRLGSARV
ncbi:MAG: 1-acyl-sn-glycerol-3-phosphate acyltransferase [Burkholderiales bacterium]|nr:1-acyl-sn-glycerol-3-phosphate acyltransferase [Burkholderiales bacterium]